MSDATSVQRSSRAHALTGEGRGKPWACLAVMAFGAVIALSPSSRAQLPDPIRISVATEIVARPASSTPLGIEIVPADALPKRSFISVRGLPAAVSLTEGRAIAAGSWTVPTTTLAALKANLPDNVSGRSEIIISLITMEGSLLAVAKTTLVVEPQAALPPPKEPAPQSTAASMLAPNTPPTSPAAEDVAAEPSYNGAHVLPPPIGGPAIGTPQPPQELSPEGTRLAEKLLAQGERHLVQADVVSARLLFRRAAEAGLAAAAMRLAATYDPVELPRMKVEGVSPNEAEARKWYERARILGATEAEGRLARLDGNSGPAARSEELLPPPHE
jgi:hypothetical protein